MSLFDFQNISYLLCFFDLSLVKKFNRFILIMPLDISFYRIFYLPLFSFISHFFLSLFPDFTSIIDK